MSTRVLSEAEVEAVLAEHESCDYVIADDFDTTFACGIVVKAPVSSLAAMGRRHLAVALVAAHTVAPTRACKCPPFPSDDEHEYVSHSGCVVTDGVATLCSRCGAWAGSLQGRMSCLFPTPREDVAEVTRNPHLPERPEDGQHIYQREPTDIGDNRRCMLCGAYRGSTESERACEGEYAESGKMRSWAKQKWADDLATRTPAADIVPATAGADRAWAERFLAAWVKPYFGDDNADAVAAVMRAATAARPERITGGATS